MADGDRQCESPEDRIERLVSEGKMPREAVDAALDFWVASLRYGLLLPNEETVRITENDLYHLIVDARIWRHPERIQHLLLGAFEIRQAQGLRRRLLGKWNEGDRTLWGYAILEHDGRVWTLHLVDERDLRKYRQESLLWPL